MAASTAFTSAMAEGDWDRCRDILVEAVSGCDQSAEVAAILHAGGINEVVYAQSQLWPEVAEALVARAQAMSTKEGALTLGWLAPLSGLWPTLIVSPNRFPQLRWEERKDFVAVVERHLDLYRLWSKDASVDRRIAGTHLLAWCSNISADDASALIAVAAKEHDPSVVATDLLTLGVMHHRLRLPGDALRDFATSHLADGDLVRLCAAIALAFVGQELGEEAILAMVDHVREPIPLPAPWQWMPLTSDALALAVLSWARTNAPETVLRRLAAVDFDLSTLPQELQSRGARNAIAATILRLAFAGRGRALPPEGLAVSDLDELQRLTVETLVKLEMGWPAFGIREAEDLANYLAGSTLQWKPIPIIVDRREHLWHFARILGAVAFGGLDPAVARDAVLRLSPADAADLATRWSSGRVFLDPNTTTSDTRILDYCLSIVLGLRERGFDMDPIFRSAPSDPSKSSPDFGILAIACLQAHPGELDADFVPLVARAIAHGWWKDPLMDQVRRLPSSLQSLVLQE